MKNEFDFDLKQIRQEVDDEEIGFRLYGDKAKPVHFAIGFFRGLLHSRSDTDLLSRFVYVVNAKGQTPRGCEKATIIEELRAQNIIDQEIAPEDIQALRSMMQSLLNADSAVFGEKGSYVSYSAASIQFVTAKARYEEVGEIGAGIIKEACPELSKRVIELLNEDDEISLLFNPVKCDVVPLDEIGQLPQWTKSAKGNDAWKNYIESIKRSGQCLCENISIQPKLLAIRTIIHFTIFHLIRFLAKQEMFHNTTQSESDILPFLSVYSPLRHSSLVDSSRSAFLQIGQSMSRFYANMYAKKFHDYNLSFRALMGMDIAPVYDKKKTKLTKSDKNRSEKNNEVWKSAKREAKETPNETIGILKLGEAIHNMVAIASDTNPNKYIRGLGSRAGILYPATSRIVPYFRFSQDITNMLILATVPNKKTLSGDEFLQRLRDNFDVVTGALESDFDFCSTHLRTMIFDEDELVKNGEFFIAQVCDMGYGKVLADGIFRIAIGE